MAYIRTNRPKLINYSCLVMAFKLTDEAFGFRNNYCGQLPTVSESLYRSRISRLGLIHVGSEHIWAND